MRTAEIRNEDLPHYTYEDYRQWEGKWELIKGIPFAMAPLPVIQHQKLCAKIERYLADLLENCNQCEVLWPVDWPITDDTVVQPDILVVCTEDGNIGVEKLEVTPVMVVEVLSPSTAHKDKVIKYRLYEEAGVRYYCIVDPQTNSATTFVLQEDKYSKDGAFDIDGMSFDFGPCQIKADFRKIFL